MNLAILLTTLALLALHACSYVPGTSLPSRSTRATTAAKPSPSPSPSAAAPSAKPSASAECMADFDAFNVRKDTVLDYDEYVDGKYGKIRFIKAPTEQEVKTMKDGFRAEAEKADTNKDGKLSREEFASTCS